MGHREGLEGGGKWQNPGCFGMLGAPRQQEPDLLSRLFIPPCPSFHP